jgi:signal transduction histidine kinase/DNA-binding response OmpR family regulator
MSDDSAARILVIDDEERMCDSLKALLTTVGYEVETAIDGDEALEIILSKEFDVILSDIKLPGKDGLELLREAKHKDPSSVVILMTAYASLESAVSAVSEGAYDYLLKPIDFSQLKLAVNRAIDKRNSDRAREQLVEELQTKNRLLKRRIAEINALYRAGKSLSTTVELPELLSQIINLATTVIGAGTGSIMLLDEEHNVLRIQAAVGVEEEVIQETTLPLGSSIAGYVAQSGKPVIIEDIEKDKRFHREAKSHYRSKSLLCVPLIVKNEILGVLNITDKTGEESFNRQDLKLLTTFASQAAMAIDDAHHYEDARRKLKQFAVLYEISSMLPETDSFDKMSSFIHNKISGIIPLDFSVWMTWNQRSGKMTITFWEGWAKESADRLLQNEIELSSGQVSSGPGRTMEVLKFIRNKLPEGDRIASFSSIPIFTQGMLFGLFCLGSLEKRAFTIDHEYISSIVASQATSVYERQRGILNATRLLTMGNMMSEISHDLRKPLTNIRGSLQVLKTRLPGESEASHIFETVDQEILRLSELVKELVDFSNPNKYQMERRKVEEAVNQVVKLVSSDAAKHNIEIETDFAENLPSVSLNLNEMIEVMLNLVMNAFDAIKDGGRIRLSTCEFRDPDEGKDYVRVEIADTGQGIEPEHLDRIFERYYTTKETGTGLGLAVVERIVMAHNGKVTSSSVPGEGTSFFIDLPI